MFAYLVGVTAFFFVAWEKVGEEKNMEWLAVLPKYHFML